MSLLSFPLVEVIHVKLSLEGGEIGVFEVDGEDFLLKLDLVNNSKGITIFIPTYNTLKVPILQHCPGFLNES